MIESITAGYQDLAAYPGASFEEAKAYALGSDEPIRIQRGTSITPTGVVQSEPGFFLGVPFAQIMMDGSSYWVKLPGLNAFMQGQSSFPWVLVIVAGLLIAYAVWG